MNGRTSSALGSQHSHLGTPSSANWKQLQFNITLKDGLNGDSLIKGASNGKFSLPVPAITLSSDG